VESVGKASLTHLTSLHYKKPEQMSGYATKTADALRLRSRRALSSWLYQDINHKYALANVQDK